MSLGKSGMQDWLIQRATAVILGFYTILLIGFFLTHSEVTYTDWHTFFMSSWVKISTLLALVSIGLHAWIGLWTVLTDYVHKISVRYFLQVIILIALFVYFVWGVQILY